MGQGVKQAPISVAVNPPEATVHVGDKQTFTAVVKGTESAGVRWSVEEKNGGQISEAGVYTAPGAPGIYHVLAISKASPGTRSVTKVTVVREADADTPQ
jgi:predicted secreted protein